MSLDFDKTNGVIQEKACVSHLTDAHVHMLFPHKSFEISYTPNSVPPPVTKWMPSQKLLRDI